VAGNSYEINNIYQYQTLNSNSGNSDPGTEYQSLHQQDRGNKSPLYQPCRDKQTVDNSRKPDNLLSNKNFAIQSSGVTSAGYDEVGGVLGANEYEEVGSVLKY